MSEIAFTQYMRPDGRRKTVLIDRPEPIAKMAAELRERGAIFEIEVLMTGHVSMTVEPADEASLDEYGAYAHEIVPNGPGVTAAVDKLIANAHRIVVGA